MTADEETITRLCEWAAQLGAIVVSVRASSECWSAQASTPNHCMFTLDRYGYLSVDEKRILYAHIQNGGSVIFLNREYADDPHTVAHEIGHVAAFLAGCDCDYRKPAPKLESRARRCGFDEHCRESNDELMAECVAWRMLELPLSPLLQEFCKAAFDAFVRRSGWKSRYRMSSDRATDFQKVNPQDGHADLAGMS